MATSLASKPRNYFATTHWTVVLSAGQSETTRGRDALAALCKTYWFPLYAFARRQGHSPHDAEDLTQGFFARLLESESLAAVSREKGKFRTFLLVALKRFLANEWHRARSQKRGGAAVHLPLQGHTAETRYIAEPVEHLTAEKLYERRWALTLLERVLTRLGHEFEAAEKKELFEKLKPYLMAEKGAIPYADAAIALSMNEGALKVAVHRLRRRFRELFREEVAQTVATPEEIDDEIRHLLTAFGP
jgi:DNA-directed RNA polymerase specialized sigma24 family protein